MPLPERIKCPEHGIDVPFKVLRTTRGLATVEPLCVECHLNSDTAMVLVVPLSAFGRWVRSAMEWVADFFGRIF